MGRPANKSWRPLLAYSTNVHRGEGLKDVYRFLEAYTLPVKKQVTGAAPAGLELRLGIGTARDLKSPRAREELKGYLDGHGLVCFSINAYPLRDFHSRRVKEQVYLPSWAEAERSRWTNAIAGIFALLLPPGITGSISTLGGTFRPLGHDPPTFRKIAANFLRTVEDLDRIERESGKTILLAVEPEPDTTFETSEDVIDFFETHLLPLALERARRRRQAAGKAEARLRRFFTVNFDTCHFSVLFQDPVESLRRLWKAGIEVGKVHVTNAVRVRNPYRSREAYAELLAMDEPRYFHQFCGRSAAGETVWRGLDLDLLPARLEQGKHPDVVELRSHYHVPIFLSKLGRLATTQDETRAAVLEVLRTRRCSQLVIETYTWPLLEREERLVKGIVKEFRWLEGVIEKAGAQKARGKGRSPASAFPLPRA
ncbi:MAG TPA: metabolite traffic protein EboE [Planctomycetota bacterium]|nr:metabolite traffic protein EboE [Planctomycetota bacterium]